MPWMRAVAVVWVCCLTLADAPRLARGAEPDKPPAPAVEKSTAADNDAVKTDAGKADEKSLERLVERVRKSVVVISFTGRDGQRQGLGSGFIISADGLVATNYHVLGEGRPVTVQLADGREFEITGVNASDRTADLAIVRIDAKDLPALALGNSDELKQGQRVVALGNPQGLKNSVVEGIVSGLREMDGRSMIQLAIPIEPGNSGGPLVDLEGRVQGILTLKSAITANLGFALTVNQLKPLVSKPNPIPISRWLTIGALNPREWKPLFGGHWRRRAGHLIGQGMGEGFGGRTLCLYQQPVPEFPCEVAVTVRLDDEEGAAGLVFCSDGEYKHFGFYPSGGKLRLTYFDGPDLFSWKVLYDQPSSDYRPGEWNTLRVRLEKGKLRAFVNDRLVVEWTDEHVAPGKVGLAKFRTTQADFKNFKVGKDLKSTVAEPADVARVERLMGKISPKGWPAAELIAALRENSEKNILAVRERARLLEQQAAQLRQLGVAVHCRTVTDALVKALEGKDEDVDIVHAALLIARLDNEELDVDAYRQEVVRMAQEIRATLAKDAGDEAKSAALRKYLFEENGFHGSRHDYYNRSNSYLNEVLDDREGLPITLSVLYLELARQLGLKVVGISLPGHFVVEYVPPQGAGQLIDVYDGAAPLSRDDAARRVREFADREITEKDLAPTTKRAIVVRMLHNLEQVAADARDLPAMIRYLDAILAVDPDSAQDRWTRARASALVERWEMALEDADWLLDKEPAGIDPEQVLGLKQVIHRAAASSTVPAAAPKADGAR